MYNQSQDLCPDSRSILVPLSQDAKAKVFLPLVTLPVSILLVELLDSIKTRHVLADTGTDLLQSLVKVAWVEDAFLGEDVLLTTD